MFPHPYQLRDLALARQRELRAEAERLALAKAARSGSRKSKPLREPRPRLPLLRAARSALAQLF